MAKCLNYKDEYAKVLEREQLRLLLIRLCRDDCLRFDLDKCFRAADAAPVEVLGKPRRESPITRS